MKVRRLAACALALSCLALLCGIRTASAANDSVRIGVAAIYPSYAIYYAAKELGFYKDQNLDVDITQFRGGPAAQEALAAGAIDICSILPTAVSLAIQKGVKEKIVALFAPPQPAGWYIMVPAASPIKSMADLNGKTVGVTQKGSLTDFWVLKAAKAANITVNTVPLGGGVDAGLRAKQVDAAILWPMYSYKGLVTGELRSIDDLGATMAPTVSEGVAASSDLIEKRPDVLRRWLAATAKAVDYMHTHESWTIAFLKRYFNDHDDKTAHMVYTNFMLKIRADGQMQQAWMKDSLELGASGGITSTLPTDAVFSTAFTPIKAAR